MKQVPNPRPHGATCRVVVVLALSALAVLAASGCMVGPKYQRPTVATPAEWRWKMAMAQAVAAPASDRWWEVFRDPVLDDLLTQALAANQDIQLAVARVDEARAKARLSKADFFPQLSADPGFNRAQNSANTFMPGAAGPIKGARVVHNYFELPLNLSYEADVWGRVRRSVAASRDRAEASVADYHAVLLTVTADTAVGYFLLRSVDSELDVLQNTLKLREESLKLVNSKFKFGAIDALDVARAKADLARTNASIADAKRRREEAVNVVAILCGKQASEFALEHRPLTAPPPEIPSALPSTLLQRRPDIAVAERTLAATNEEIGVAQAAFFPTFALTANGGVQSKELSNLAHWPSVAWTLAANLAQPVFTGGRNRAELDAARARYDQALAAYRQQVLVAFKDVEDALLDIQFLAEQAKALDEAVQAARQVTTLATTRYDQGQVSYLDVVDAQRQQLEVEQQAVAVLGLRMTAAVRMSKALGGGWNSEGAVAPGDTQRPQKAQDETHQPIGQDVQPATRPE